MSHLEMVCLLADEQGSVPVPKHEGDGCRANRAFESNHKPYLMGEREETVRERRDSQREREETEGVAGYKAPHQSGK